MHEAAVRAAAYVDAHGDALARLRAAALLGDEGSGRVLETLAPDDAPSLRRALAIADDLRALAHPRVRDWAERLASACADDGGWSPGAPLDERLFETGMIAGHLAKTRWVRPELLAGAGDFLARYWSPDRVQGRRWSAIAAHAHLFANADHDAADAVLQWCGRELGRGFVTRAFDAVRTARVLVWCDAHGLPGAELRVPDLLVALVTEQRPDGSFPRWDGEGARDAIESTLDGLVAIRRLAGRR